MRISRRIALARIPLLAAALAGLTGCAATSDHMQEARSPAVLPRANPASAVVYFVRPSSYAATMRTTIIDGRGRFLGDSLPSSYFAVAVPPGQHLFVGWAENTAALRATLAPGRTYYVEVAPRPGFMSPRVQLLAISPRSSSWGNLKEWLAESTPLVVDERSGQRYLAERAEDVRERLRRGAEIMGEYDAEERVERTLLPQDGL